MSIKTWISKNDITLHVWAGILIVFLSGFISYKLFGTYLLSSTLIGFIIGNIAGVSKEFIWDKWLKKGTFSWLDMLDTFWGTLVGSIALIATIASIEGMGV